MRVKILSLLCVLFSASLFACGCSIPRTVDESEIILLDTNSNYDPNAIVLLVHIGQNQHILASLPRVAFTVGDGTIIITAAHCVRPPSNWPDESMSSEIIAVSPYYGDCFDCQILAVDEEADIAILKAAWQKHPALSIASPEELNTTEQVTIFSRPIAKPKRNYQMGRQIRAYTIDVDQINEGNTRAGIVLKGTGPVKHGWSGSAIVIPDSANVAGVISSLSGFGIRIPAIISIGIIFNAVGSNVQSIWKLLEKNDLQYIAKSYFPEKFESVEQSEPAFSGFMEYFEAIFHDDQKQAYETTTRLRSIRPESAYANLFYALSCDMLALNPDSDSLVLFKQAITGYEKAIEQNPGNAHLHSIYSNCLISHNLYSEAINQAESALAIDPNNYPSSLNRLMVLARTDSVKAEQYALQLIEKDSKNADYQYYYGISLLELGRCEQALDAVQKAIKINRKGRYYGGLADIYIKLGNMKKAESNFKKMTKICGCQVCWFNYAEFLVHHRPNKLEIAQIALEQAEQKAYMIKVPPEKIAALKRELQSEMQQ